MHFSYYKKALALDLKPILLEFTHPIKKTPLYICGINPTTILKVVAGKLYQDDLYIGAALDIFAYLEDLKGNKFFPAFLGYFAYEFARHFSYPTKNKVDFPDAYFGLYEQGLVIDDNKIIHHDQLEILDSKYGSLDFLLNKMPTYSSWRAKHGYPGNNFWIATPITWAHNDGGVSYDENTTKNTLLRNLTPSLLKTQFIKHVELIKEQIKNGDVYQVNFSLPCYFDMADDEILDIYEAMREHNNSPFMGIIKTNDFSIVSGSPERLFSLHNNCLTSRPIAGTKKRGKNPAEDDANIKELKSCPKENAEHAMLVDLIRNDLNKIALPGSVEVNEDRSVEFYSHVMHLVSEVSAYTHKNLLDVMTAIFPGGTITGAPKYNVMKSIMDLEITPRGPYTGSLGYISSGYGIDFNILIRSIFKYQQCTQINTGAGIVIDSNPEKEWQEVNLKAQGVRDILLGNKTGGLKREIIRGKNLLQRQHKSLPTKPRVLFYENQDSFSFNIIEAIQSLGAVVDIAQKTSNFSYYSHVVMGPGPGNPKNMPDLLATIAKIVDLDLPLLGICLGHQAMGHFFGASIKRALCPVHGKNMPINHNGQGLFLGMPSPSMHTRYHSLVIDKAPLNFVVDARSDDDEIMAIRHATKPLFGLQFHPESYLSINGLHLFKQFLQQKPCS